MEIDRRANLTVLHHIGAAKEDTGRIPGNEGLKREGQDGQSPAKLQEAGERVKYAPADIGDHIRDATGKLRDGFGKE
jgi:uncharacterized protein YjbJ (UPF0337 family)